MTQRGDIVQLTITHLAGLGDGVGLHDHMPVFVPLTAAGDVVRAELLQLGKDRHHARVVEWLQPSPQRVAPPCVHYGECGGCALQHLHPAAYADFKRGIAVEAAQALSSSADIVAPLFQAGAASRRRAEVKVTVQEGMVALGFVAARSHDVVAAPDCQVVTPALRAAMSYWREVVQGCKKPARLSSLHLTEADNGLDIMLHAASALKPADIQHLHEAAQAAPATCRVGLVVDAAAPRWLRLGEPSVTFGDAAVELPPAAFLQATRPSQQAIIAAVVDACGDAPATVADIYCGLGTFSLPLAQAGHRVLAYEGSEPAVTALFNAARKHGWEDRLAAVTRDVYAEPLTHELQSVSVAVINPPRNGALPQCTALAASAVGRVVMVSCNPATFIRDGKALLAGGFHLQSLLPVDQFTWSHHLELVGVFCRTAQ